MVQTCVSFGKKGTAMQPINIMIGILVVFSLVYNYVKSTKNKKITIYLPIFKKKNHSNRDNKNNTEREEEHERL